MTDVKGPSGCEGHRQYPTGVLLSWSCTDGGRAVEGALTSADRPIKIPFQLDERSPVYQRESSPTFPFYTELTLTLQGDVAQLSGVVSAPGSRPRPEILAKWEIERPRPLPSRPDTIAGVVIEDPGAARETELFSFTWTHPPRAAETGDLQRRFVVCTDPERLPFFIKLRDISGPDGDGARAAMRSAALDFMQGPVFAPTLASLGEVAVRYPRALAAVAALDGPQLPAALLSAIEHALGVEPLSSYVASAGYRETGDRLWQSLFAAALASPPGSTTRAALVEGLRAWALLSRIDRRDPLLDREDGRAAALGAIVIVPGDVVPPASDPAQGWAALLGVGDVHVVWESLLGYEMGEIESVVNVMRREQQVRREETRTLEATESGVVDETATGLGTSTEQSRTADLQSEVREVLAGEGACRSYDGLTVTYGDSGLDFTIGGTSRGNESLEGRDGALAWRRAEQITRRAARSLSERVARWRRSSRTEERIRIQRRRFENQGEGGDLVGVYRWLQKVHRLRAGEAARRLIVEIHVASPAAAWKARIAAKRAPPLVPPEPVGVSQYQDVAPENYLQLAAAYGLRDLAPPPDATRTLSVGLQSDSPMRRGQIDVPPGYTLDSEGTAAYLIGDNTYSIAVSVGGVTFTIPAGSPPEAGMVAATDPGDCPGPRPPCRPTPAAGALKLTGLQGRRIVVSVVTAAPSFALEVELGCTADQHADQLAAWQLETYQAITAAFGAAQLAYQDALASRIAAAADGRAYEVQRAELERGGMDVLWALHGAPGPSPPDDPTMPVFLRFFQRAFEWAEMAWAYAPWEPGAPGPPLHSWPGERVLRDRCGEMFTDFLQAGSARVLVAIRPGFELSVMYYLRFGELWPAPVAPPISERDVPWVLDLEKKAPAHEGRSWEVVVPTSLVILQSGGALLDGAGARR